MQFVNVKIEKNSPDIDMIATKNRFYNRVRAMFSMALNERSINDEMQNKYESLRLQILQFAHQYIA